MRIRRKKKQRFSNSQTNIQPQLQPRSFVAQSSNTNQAADLQTLREKTQQSEFNFAEIPIFAATQVNNSLPIQPKLTIGAPGDKYEQEADRVAHQVVNQINSPQAQNIQREAIPEEKEEAVQTKSANNSSSPQVDKLMRKVDISKIQLEAMPKEDEVQRMPIVQRFGQIMAGEASSNFESSLQNAQAGGQQIADKVRRPMEGAFGTDFSQVKIHTDTKSDQLNRSIQAKAFTTGNDIFFRKGEYNPSSKSGQELIAHELTHVVQQKSCNDVQKKSALIQRAVGFEYQIPWFIQKVIPKKWKYGTDTYEPFDKKTVLYDHKHFNLETDGPEIELVVDPPLSDQLSEQEFLGIFSSIEQFAATMEAEVQNNVDEKEQVNAPLNFIPNRNNFVIDTKGEHNLKAAPQATIAISLDRVPTLFQSLGDDKNEDNKELIGMQGGMEMHAKKLRNAANYNIPKVGTNDPSPELKGLASMIFLYLKQLTAPILTDTHRSRTKALKYLLFLMSRTQFGRLFEELPNEEKVYFKTDVNRWVDYICNTMNINADQELVSYGITDQGKLNDDPIVFPMTRREWLVKMTRGIDVLTAKAHPLQFGNNKEIYQDSNPELGSRLRGVGALDRKMDSLANGKQGTIMEIRVMDIYVPYRDWKMQALSIFRYINEINNARLNHPMVRVENEQGQQQNVMGIPKYKRIKETAL